MFSRLGVMTLLVIFLFTTTGTNLTLAQTDSEVEKIRNRVDKYGVGKKVTVKLRDTTKFKGRISKIERDSFAVENKKTGESKTFEYRNVKKVKKSSLTKWILIGVAAGIAVAVIIPLSRRCRNEGANALCL